MKKLKTTTIVLFGVSLITSGLMAQQQQGQQPSQQSQEQKFQEVEAEYLEMEEQVKEVESKASRNKEVASAEEEYESTLKEKIVEINPDLEEKVEKRDEIAKKIENISGEELDEGEEEDLEELYMKDNELQQALFSTENEAKEKKEVKEKKNKYEEVLLDQMKEIDPEIEDKMEKRDELGDEYEHLLRKAKAG